MGGLGAVKAGGSCNGQATGATVTVNMVAKRDTKGKLKISASDCGVALKHTSFRVNIPGPVGLLVAQRQASVCAEFIISTICTKVPYFLEKSL